MKYENFKRCASIVDQIVKKEKLLEDLNSPSLTVIINYNEQSGRIMTIGAVNFYEHDYTPLAVQFIEQIRTDCKATIATLKAELEQL